MSNKFVKTYKQECTASNCGFDHDPIDSIVRSQWQSRSKNYLYLLYRWLVAIVATASVIVSFVSHIERYSVALFFIYLTHWGILVNMIVAIYGAILVTFWHFSANFKGMAGVRSACYMNAESVRLDSESNSHRSLFLAHLLAA